MGILETNFVSLSKSACFLFFDRRGAQTTVHIWTLAQTNKCKVGRVYDFSRLRTHLGLADALTSWLLIGIKCSISSNLLKTVKYQMGNIFSHSWAYPETKTFQGGKIKIFMIIKGLHVQISHFFNQTLGADQKKKILASKSSKTLCFCDSVRGCIPIIPPTILVPDIPGSNDNWGCKKSQPCFS